MKTYKLGMTGTREGMTKAQKRVFRKALKDSFRRGAELHHGDCIGSDADANKMAAKAGYKTVAHPPDRDKYRAFCESDQIRKPYPYITRDRNIVREVFAMIATPKSKEEEMRGSGTWATIRWARRCKKRLLIIWPDGTFEKENW